LSLFDSVPPFLKIDGSEPFKDTTSIAPASLFVAFALMILNRVIIRFFEGYWRVNLGRRTLDLSSKWNGYYVRQWRGLQSQILRLTRQRDNCQRAGVPFKNRRLRNRVMEEFAVRYPNKQELVLPTKLGNAIRALEDYSRVMYGFESITGWSRLNAVISKEYRELMDEARADLNLWLNILFIDLLLLVGYLLLAVLKWDTPLVWLIVPSLALLPFYLSARATRAAIDWGEWVKGSFDIYLPELKKKPGFSQPMSPDEEREFWIAFSQAITYRRPEPLVKIAKFREGSEKPVRLILP
jgi:hypothetical protein